MSISQSQETTPSTSIDPATQVGLAALTVTNLERSVTYYTTLLGFTVMQRDKDSAVLGVPGTPLLLLTEDREAQPWPEEGFTGLYHFAILLPSRADLGRWLGHWIEQTSTLPGQGDHLVSEALYLRDPDRHGIEIYRDRPRSEWRYVNGKPQMGGGPVDIRGVLATAAEEGKPWEGFPAGTRIGHMHLQVGDLASALRFYHEILGFDVTEGSLQGALFVSAGGYHHHLGLNIWHSRGAGPAPAGVAGLRFYTFELANAEAREAVVARVRAAGLTATEADNVIALQDPWQNTILLHIGAISDAEAAAALLAAHA